MYANSSRMVARSANKGKAGTKTKPGQSHIHQMNGVTSHTTYIKAPHANIPSHYSQLLFPTRNCISQSGSKECTAEMVGGRKRRVLTTFCKIKCSKLAHFIFHHYYCTCYPQFLHLLLTTAILADSYTRNTSPPGQAIRGYISQHDNYVHFFARWRELRFS